MSNVLYLFCFARTDRLPAIETLGGGIANNQGVRAELFLREALGITAVLCNVQIEEFTGPQAISLLKDLSWLTPRACSHQEVVEQVMHHSPVFPARFGTLFSEMARLDDLMFKHHDAIWAFLEYADDHEEWGIKGLVDRTKAEQYIVSERFAELKNNIQSLTPGKRYLYERSLRSNAKKNLDHWLCETADTISRKFRGFSSDFRSRKPISPSAIGRTEDMSVMLNCSVLVSRTSHSKLQAQIDQLNRSYATSSVTFDISGPWPPYSFCPPIEMDRST